MYTGSLSTPPHLTAYSKPTTYNSHILPCHKPPDQIPPELIHTPRAYQYFISLQFKMWPIAWTNVIWICEYNFYLFLYAHSLHVAPIMACGVGVGIRVWVRPINAILLLKLWFRLPKSKQHIFTTFSIRTCVYIHFVLIWNKIFVLYWLMVMCMLLL